MICKVCTIENQYTLPRCRSIRKWLVKEIEEMLESLVTRRKKRIKSRTSTHLQDRKTKETAI